MNDLKMFNFETTTDGETATHEVRVVTVDDNPWWVLTDVCRVLGVKDASMVADRLDDDEKGTSQIGTIDSNGKSVKRQVTIVNESGLYSVILRSDKPQAKPFRKWVTSEVLPSIRKTGSYQTKPLTLAELFAQQVQINLDHERQLAAIPELQADMHKIKGLTKQLENTPINQLPSGYLGVRASLAKHGKGLSEAIVMDYIVPYYRVGRSVYMVFHEEGGLKEARCLNTVQFKSAIESFVGTLTQVTSKFCESDILPSGKRVRFSVTPE